VENYKVGTLVVDMYDAKNKLIWRGTASDTLSNKLQKNEKNLDKSVDKMFKNFRPRECKLITYVNNWNGGGGYRLSWQPLLA